MFSALAISRERKGKKRNIRLGIFGKNEINIFLSLSLSLFFCIDIKVLLKNKTRDAESVEPAIEDDLNKQDSARKKTDDY